MIYRNIWRQFWSSAALVTFIAILLLLILCALLASVGPIQMKIMEILGGEPENSYADLWMTIPLWVRFIGCGFTLVVSGVLAIDALGNLFAKAPADRPDPTM